MTERRDNLQGLWEDFDYDDLNRVETITTHAGSGSLSKTNTYDALGNITSKPGVGAYSYDPARPHVITAAGQHTYTHDANGNLFSGAGKSITSRNVQYHALASGTRWLDPGLGHAGVNFFFDNDGDLVEGSIKQQSDGVTKPRQQTFNMNVKQAP